MSRFLYFAYGSNLLAERLTARCPSAEPVGLASVSGRRLAFQSKSFDGSGKATLVEGTAEDVVHGRLYEIDLDERAALDRVEGADRTPPVYIRHDDFTVTREDGSEATGVSVYLAREATDPLAPWDWYRALIIAGGMQAGLPAADVAALAVSPAMTDVLPTRKTRLEALRILGEAGFPALAQACGGPPVENESEAETATPTAATLDAVAERAVAAAVALI